MPVLWAGWSHWDGQSRHRKAWLGQEQGQESRELQLWVPLSAQGPSHRLSLVPAQQWQQHQRGAVVFSSNQKCPFPTAWRGWDTHQEIPPVPQNCTEDKDLSPQGLGEEPAPVIHVLGTFLQPLSGIWGLQGLRNTCTHLSRSKHFPKIQSFHFSHSLPALHCGSLLGILGFCASFWLFHGQLWSGGWI